MLKEEYTKQLLYMVVLSLLHPLQTQPQAMWAFPSQGASGLLPRAQLCLPGVYLMSV